MVLRCCITGVTVRCDMPVTPPLLHDMLYYDVMAQPSKMPGPRPGPGGMPQVTGTCGRPGRHRDCQAAARRPGLPVQVPSGKFTAAAAGPGTGNCHGHGDCQPTVTSHGNGVGTVIRRPGSIRDSESPDRDATQYSVVTVTVIWTRPITVSATALYPLRPGLPIRV
jgi:hypothetical protein